MLTIWELKKGVKKLQHVITGLTEIYGMIFLDKENNSLLIYGKNNGKNIPIRTFLFKTEGDNFQITQKFDIIKEFLKEFSYNILCH